MRKGQLNRHTRYRPATTARNTATLRGRATRWTNTPVRIFKDPAPTPIPAMLHLSAPMPVVVFRYFVLFFTFSPQGGLCVVTSSRATGAGRDTTPATARSTAIRQHARRHNAQATSSTPAAAAHSQTSFGPFGHSGRPGATVVRAGIPAGPTTVQYCVYTRPTYSIISRWYRERSMPSPYHPHQMGYV